MKILENEDNSIIVGKSADDYILKYQNAVSYTHLDVYKRQVIHPFHQRNIWIPEVL